MQREEVDVVMVEEEEIYLLLEGVVRVPKVGVINTHNVPLPLKLQVAVLHPLGPRRLLLSLRTPRKTVMKLPKLSPKISHPPQLLPPFLS